MKPMFTKENMSQLSKKKYGMYHIFELGGMFPQSAVRACVHCKLYSELN